MQKTILETKGLILETLDDHHFDDLFKLLSNKNVHKYFPKALNKEESLEFLNKVKCKYDEDGFSFWAVIRKGDQEFLGICGILKQIISGTEEVEVGYRILDNYWGDGYGTEAAGGCIQYGKDVLQKQSIVACIRDVNKQSIRVAEKNGLLFEKNIIFHDLPHRLYRKTFDKPDSILR
jgi:ribosomal-protein-alanine N-acetyltransferase